MARTRSHSAHQKVLNAAIELVADRGVEATSMDAIAARSGVSKATLYSHWPDKDSLLLEMLVVATRLHERPAFDSGRIRSDIVEMLAYRGEDESGIRDRLMPHVIAYSATHRKFGKAWRATMMEPPRRDLRRLLAAGVAQGLLVESLDVEMSLPLLLGPMMYWFMFLREDWENPRLLAEAVVETFWRAYGRRRR